MRDVSDEPDYLARAKPDFDPNDFRQVVKDVFALEYGLTKDYQIADLVGRDRSRISQMFKRPERVKPETIQLLLSHIAAPRNRERVVEAWKKVHAPDPGLRSSSGSEIGDRVTKATRSRIDRLVRLEKLPLAARLSYQAAVKASDGDLRETLLDRAYFLHQRLDRPGVAMSIARHVAVGARKRREPHREAAAHFMRVRILIGLADASAEELMPCLDEAEALVRGIERPEKKEYLTVDAAVISSMRESVAVELMVRGRMEIDEDFVRSVRTRRVAEARSSKEYQRKFGCYVMAARCYLLLGDAFGADEMLEKAYRSGHAKNLHLAPIASLMKSRIMEATETPEERAEYLLEVVKTCAASNDIYHLRLAEGDLARVQAGRFPAFVKLD